MQRLLHTGGSCFNESINSFKFAYISSKILMQFLALRLKSTKKTRSKNLSHDLEVTQNIV